MEEREIGADEAEEYLGAIRIGAMFGLSALHHYKNPKARNWLNMFGKIDNFLKGIPTTGVVYHPPKVERVIKDKSEREFIVSTYERLFKLAKSAKANENIDEKELMEAIKAGEQTLDVLENQKKKYMHFGSGDAKYAF